MTQEEQRQEKPGPLPQTREAVDWWLKEWGRQSVVDGQEPLNRQDVERLIEVNGGTAEGLYLYQRNLQQIQLPWINKSGEARPFDLQGVVLADAKLEAANLYLADLQRADLARANLQEANLGVADLRGSNLFKANLESSNLSETNLRGARLTYANLTGANLWFAHISPETDLEGVNWDDRYISVVERKGDYEAAIALYRRLKEWYRGAGMLIIAGEFHYREQEAIRKAQWQRLGSGFRGQLVTAWQRLKGEAPRDQSKE